MKKKNGFVFVETMITVVILSAALLVIYSLFNNILIKEKRRSYFDDPIYIYRANYLTLIFENIINNVSTYKSDANDYVTFTDLLISGYTTDPNTGNLTPTYNKFMVFTCNNDMFNDEGDTKAECQQFFRDNQIYQIYISQYDLSYIDNCSKNSGVGSDCTFYRGLNNQAKQYLKQLTYTPNAPGYYIIFEFNDDGNGGVCTNDNCMHQFASVKFGGSNKVYKLYE